MKQSTPQMSLFDFENVESAEGTSPETLSIRYSQQIVDEALTLGANDRNSRLVIAAYFMKDHTLAENAAFLRQLYREGGAGFYLDGKQYSVWYDYHGFYISTGESVHGFMAMTLTWEEVAKRVRELFDLGRYMPDFLLAGVNMYERLTLASDLLLTARDLSDEGKERGLLPSFQSLRGAFDDEQKAIVSLMASPASLQNLIDEWRTFDTALKENDDVLRFRRLYPSKRLLSRLEDLQREPVMFRGDQAASSLPERFITQDEIDMALRHGSSRTGSDYRLDIYAFFRSHSDLKEREKYLKDKYGTGGSSGGSGSTSYDAKGFSFSHGDIAKPYAKIDMTWTAVARRIDTLIVQNRFLTDEDRAYMPEYERRHLALAIYNALSDSVYASDVVKDGYIWDNVERIQKELTDPVRVHELYSHVHDLWSMTLSDNRRYDVIKQAYQDITAYRGGEYTLFGLSHDPIPAPEAHEEPVLAVSDELETAKQLINTYAIETFDEEANFSNLAEIPLGMRDTDDGAHTIEITADLESFEILYSVDNRIVHFVEADSLKSLLPYLASLDFDGLIDTAMQEYNTLRDQEEKAGLPEEPFKRREYAVGDTVYLDGTAFQITNLTDREVELLDPTLLYPIFRAESRENFERLLRQDSRNQSLLPEKAESEPAEEVKLNSITIDLRPSWEREIEQPKPQPIPQDNGARFNFHIDDDHLGEGGAKTKFRRNMNAIELLKTIEEDHRFATPEEQEVLSQYVGWGGLPQVFDAENEQWKAEYAELKAALSEEEYETGGH